MYRHNVGVAPLAPAPGRWAPSGGRAAGLARLAGLACLGLAVAACGGQPAGVALPHKAGTAAAGQAGASGPGRTPRQLVAGAYQGYWRAYAAAMTASDPGRARRLLAPYQAPAGMPRLIGSLRRVWAAHDVAYGAAITHLKDVRISGSTAMVHDCLDLSHFGVLDTATGRVVPDSFGLANLNYYVTLELSGGRWRVSNMQPVEVPCTP
jgi:hypothetical protein